MPPAPRIGLAAAASSASSFCSGGGEGSQGPHFALQLGLPEPATSSPRAATYAPQLPADRAADDHLLPTTAAGRPPPPREPRPGKPHPGAELANGMEEPREPDGATIPWLRLAESAPESAIPGAPRMEPSPRTPLRS